MYSTSKIPAPKGLTVGGDGGDDRLSKQASLSKRNKMQER